MVKKIYYTWQDVEKMCVNIVTQMYKDNWKPDYIVGITRGGNVPATIISNMTGIRCEALKVSLRDDDKGETRTDMSRDAFLDRKKILIVDDINDTGSTFEWIQNDWKSSMNTGENPWGDTVRFAVLTENLSSKFDGVSYHCDEVNKAEEDCWLVYPWENVGEY
jgi:hypoxanthine phosphoribosyltransferase